MLFFVTFQRGTFKLKVCSFFCLFSFKVENGSRVLHDMQQTGRFMTFVCTEMCFVLICFLGFFCAKLLVTFQ